MKTLREITENISLNFVPSQNSVDGWDEDRKNLSEAIEKALTEHGQAEYERGVREAAEIARTEEVPNEGEMPNYFLSLSREAIGIGSVKATMKNIEKRILNLIPTKEEENK